MDENKMIEMRLAHLNMIQAVIVRISGFSASAKNFCITVLAALIAVGFQKPIPVLYLAAISVVIVFALMDAYYLALERHFRALFETVAQRPFTDIAISLKPQPIGFRAIFGALKSASISIMYVFLMLTTEPLLYVAGRMEPPKTGTECATNGH